MKPARRGPSTAAPPAIILEPVPAATVPPALAASGAGRPMGRLNAATGSQGATRPQGHWSWLSSRWAAESPSRHSTETAQMIYCICTLRCATLRPTGQLGRPGTTLPQHPSRCCRPEKTTRAPADSLADRARGTPLRLQPAARHALAPVPPPALQAPCPTLPDSDMPRPPGPFPVRTPPPRRPLPAGRRRAAPGRASPSRHSPPCCCVWGGAVVPAWPSRSSWGLSRSACIRVVPATKLGRVGVRGRRRSRPSGFRACPAV